MKKLFTLLLFISDENKTFSKFSDKNFNNLVIDCRSQPNKFSKDFVYNGKKRSFLDK